VVRHHPIPVERAPRTGPQNQGMSTGVDLETGESIRPDAPEARSAGESGTRES
jgi:hypothetical protein